MSKSPSQSRINNSFFQPSKLENIKCSYLILFEVNSLIKTKAIVFHNAVKYDFLPNLSIENDSQIEVVDEIWLLRVQVRADLSWRSNTLAMCQNAYSRLWMLRRLKPLGTSVDELDEVYDKQIRCMVELASPVVTPGITLEETNQLERVQKAAFAIILGNQYTSYARALTRTS